MGKTENSYISRYLVEQDSVKAPVDLYENTYQRLQEYQLAQIDSVNNSETALLEAEISTTPLMTLILSFSAIAVTGLIYLMIMNGNQEQPPYGEEDGHVSGEIEYVEQDDPNDEGYQEDDGTLGEAQDVEAVNPPVESEQPEEADWIFELIIRPFQDD